MKILLATDGSKHATEAAELLARLPHKEPLELTVLFVSYAWEAYGSQEVVEWMERSLAAERARASKVFEHIQEMFSGADVGVECVFLKGQVGKTIIEQAKSRNIELVVLGAVGHSTLDRLLLGSTSDFVATHAHCSVLIVRPMELSQHGPRICWAFDDSQAAHRAAQQLAKFLWSRQTQIDVVQVAARPELYAEIPIVVDIEEIKQQLLPKVQAASNELHQISERVTPHVIDALTPGSGLVKFAQQHDTDLVLMGDTGRGLLSRFLLGSVSRYVLRHAGCSVWITREVATVE
ncbi:MAG: universal stress protein [Pirellulaceae bacterium]|jgi:nucleotide-binding universal stress UspA family protein|nr:universal stress protein [Pirellulaceae bacterium]